MIFAAKCTSCRSSNLREFFAEMNIHGPGMDVMNTPSVWLFPRTLVCMDCGSAEFTVPGPKRREIAAKDDCALADEVAA